MSVTREQIVARVRAEIAGVSDDSTVPVLLSVRDLRALLAAPTGEAVAVDRGVLTAQALLRWSGHPFTSENIIEMLRLVATGESSARKMREIVDLVLNVAEDHRPAAPTE